MIKYIEEEGIIAPLGESVNADIAITTFSTHLFDELVAKTGAKAIGVMPGSVEIKVYACELNGKRVAIYQSPIGAPAAVGAIEEIYAGGVKKVIAFGICGALIPTPMHTVIVPTRAYRDEGTSYHYMPTTEYVELTNSGFVQSALEKNGIKTVTGGAWTTDGFYRETRTRMSEMKGNGCICVDMECSALQAAANFRKKEFYTFFISADSLAGDEWEPNDILHSKLTDSKAAAVYGAMQLALLL
ncbi:MAG: nucleoside phosphorylase [Clostridiales bacterium]|nr:nucleoside phosphorylase [Clostridiales bacterium]